MTRDRIRRAERRGRLPGWSARIAGVVLSVLFVVLAASAARAETRILKFYNLHTKERAEIPYKNGGRYIKSGLKKINYILRDWRHDEEVAMNPRLLDLIWTVYQQTGSNDYINVICGYRNSETNSMLRKRSSGVAKKSQHMLGNALDFYLPDVKLSKLRAVGLKLQEGGVGYYPRSGSPFVHMDVGNVRHWPRMSRRELVSLFPDGRTMHVPADGKPLPGYNQALAAYKARQDDPIRVAGGAGSGGGLLASLFGGGADEEEDNAESAAPARTVSAPQPPVAPANPVAAPDAPAIVLASISADALPVPRAAPRRQSVPRPDIAVGRPVPERGPERTPVPSNAVASAKTDTANEDALAPVMMAAMNVPTPTRRPDYTPSAKPATASTLVAMTSEAPEGEGADAIADILAREEGPRVTPEMTASLIPQPSARPAREETRLDYEFMPRAATTPTSDEAARSTGIEDVETQFGVPTRRARPVTDSPRLAMLEREADEDPVAVVAGHMKTTGKDAKPTRRDARPVPKPIVVPIEAASQPHRVLSASRLRRDWEKTGLPNFDARMMRAPETVYTGGFRPEGGSEEDQRFTGQAVTFLAVARFATN